MKKFNVILFVILLTLISTIVAMSASRDIKIVTDADSSVSVICTDSTLFVSSQDAASILLQCVSLVPTPTPTILVVSTSTSTSTSIPTATESPTDTPPPQPTSTDTPTDVPTNTETSTPAPTDTATSTATAIPTDTSTSTPTATSTSTATATPTSSAPIALKDYPLCTTHDVTKWHSSIDATNQCHYDHSHGDNPALADDIFGPWTFGNQTVSYPHASSPAENMYEQFIGSINPGAKHAGYFYIVRKNLPDSPVALPNWNTPVNSYVRDVRAQVHFWGAGDTKVRFHSVYYEIRVQNKATGQYGIIKTGGLMDTGILELYKLQWIPVLGQDPTAAELENQWLPMYDEYIHDSIDPYRGYKQSCSQLAQRMGWDEFWDPQYNMTVDNTGLSNDVLWSLAPNVHGYNKIAGVSIEKFDNSDCIEAGPVNLTNPYSATYEIKDICTLGGRPNCRLNGSEVAMFMAYVIVPQSWDNSTMDENPLAGVITMHQWTNNKQELVNGCTVASYNCIPLILENMPVGNSFFQWDSNGKQQVSEFDLTPVDHIVNGRWESWHRQ